MQSKETSKVRNTFTTIFYLRKDKKKKTVMFPYFVESLFQANL